YGERVSARPVRIGVGGEAVWGLDPAPVNVDRPGPVREDVPGNGLLGDGLTGEHNRLEGGLKSRTPAIPLLSRIGSGSSDVASFRTGKNRISAGRIVRAI